MYAMIGTRPDLAVAVSVVSKFLDKPNRTDCDMVLRIFQYFLVLLKTRQVDL